MGRSALWSALLCGPLCGVCPVGPALRLTVLRGARPMGPALRLTVLRGAPWPKGVPPFSAPTTAARCLGLRVLRGVASDAHQHGRNGCLATRTAVFQVMGYLERNGAISHFPLFEKSRYLAAPRKARKSIAVEGIPAIAAILLARAARIILGADVIVTCRNCRQP